jgi:hypothetical protein
VERESKEDQPLPCSTSSLKRYPWRDLLIHYSSRFSGNNHVTPCLWCQTLLTSLCPENPGSWLEDDSFYKRLFRNSSKMTAPRYVRSLVIKWFSVSIRWAWSCLSVHSHSWIQWFGEERSPTAREKMIMRKSSWNSSFIWNRSFAVGHSSVSLWYSLDPKFTYEISFPRMTQRPVPTNEQMNKKSNDRSLRRTLTACLHFSKLMKWSSELNIRRQAVTHTALSNS